MSDPVLFEIRNPDGDVVYSYAPTPKQLIFHTTNVPNCIMEGSRGTGKSVAIRNDAHMRALAVPGISYLIIRRTMPELRLSHLKYIDSEMTKLGGRFNKTEGIAYYPNGSLGFFTHCETEADMMRLLSSEFAIIYFDEITTFTRDMITKISTCIRVPEGSGITALIRGGTNPIGEGADYVYSYYISKEVDPEDDPEYNPTHYLAIHMTLEDNEQHLDMKQYRQKFSHLPDQIRRAWLDAEWLIQGAYFMDFRPKDENKQPWHVTPHLPTVQGVMFTDIPWIKIYRAIDWGFHPDPAVCLWIAALPDGREIVFKERTWYRTRAADVACHIKEESYGMKIAETYCDPSIFVNSEATGSSVGDIFEMNGVPLVKSSNNRAAAGFAIHEHLNTILPDGLPKLQIWQPDRWQGAAMLIKTFPMLRMDKNDPTKIANGQDHWVIALAYYCMALVGPSSPVPKRDTRLFRQPKMAQTHVLGSRNISRRR